MRWDRTLGWLAAMMMASLRVRAGAASPPVASAPHLDLARRAWSTSPTTTAPTPCLAGDAPETFQLQVLSSRFDGRRFFYAANRFCGPEHGGTHLDAPRTFAEGLVGGRCAGGRG